MMSLTDEHESDTAGIREIAHEVGLLYPAIYRRFHVSHHVLPGTDVTLRMLMALQHLAADGPLTVGELALHLGLSKAATTELVDRIKAKGLVDRIHDDRDRRRVFIWLTEKGRERTQQHSQPKILADEILFQAILSMQPDERQQLIQGLRALLHAGEEINNADMYQLWNANGNRE
jgi:DNA-binding MarR family transcriptional regulator